MTKETEARDATFLHTKPIAVVAAIGMAMATTLPAYAAIDNTASATGTFGGTDVDSNDSSVAVPVITGAPDLAIVKTGALLPAGDADGDGNLDAGDTITYTYTVTNNGNVSMTAVTPVDVGPTFDGTAGTNALSAFTLTSASADIAPTESATFTATYTLSALDAYRAAGVTDGVANSATASGTLPGGGTYDDPDPDTHEETIATEPSLAIVKSFVLNDEVTSDGLAEATETITYTYTITNDGNVPLTNVVVNDTHEGAAIPAASFTGETITVASPLGTSDIGTANDGVIDILAPGATATVTYTHTVTQTEVDNG